MAVYSSYCTRFDITDITKLSDKPREAAELRPNGWTDQDETWHAGRPWPWSYCVTRGLIFLSPKGPSPQFSAHICCGQIAGWIKMPLGMEVGLGPGGAGFVLDEDRASPSNFRPMSIVVTVAHLSHC